MKEYYRIISEDKSRFNNSEGGKLSPLKDSSFKKSYDQWEEKGKSAIGGYSVPENYRLEKLKEFEG
jgi:hypothetical protein